MSKDKIAAQLETLVGHLLQDVPEEAHEYILEQLTQMSEKVVKRNSESNDSERAVDIAKAKAVIAYHLPMGEALHAIAQMDMLDSEEPWEDLSPNAQNYWATLAFRIGFDPEQEQCPCLDHLAECYDELYQEGKVDPVTPTSAGNSPEMVEVEVSNPSELPDALMKVLRERGIDPNDVTIKTMRVPKSKSH